jgi:signal peptidase II
MIINIKTKLYFVSLSIFIVLIDQFTKYLMFYNKKLFINKDFLLFKLDFVKNYGAAFNIFSGSRVFLSLISIFFSIILIYLILRKKFRKNTLNSSDLYSYSFILGGTIGNGIDRIYRGFVVDFINLNIINFPVFNIADISINIGFIILLYNIFKNNR